VESLVDLLRLERLLAALAGADPHGCTP